MLYRVECGRDLSNIEVRDDCLLTTISTLTGKALEV